MFLPGTHIPIYDPVEHLAEQRPDYILILPWNLREEITGQLAHTREWGGAAGLPASRPWRCSDEGRAVLRRHGDADARR